MANILKIKRGLKADISKLTLVAGELAVALDTQELYVGDNEGNVKIVKGGASGAVESAGKLTIERTITAIGDASGSTSFDGSKNVEMALELATSGVTAGTYSKVTVDAKGRVTAGANITVEDIGDLSTTLAGLATKEELGGYVKTTDLTTELNKKVDKETGKQLSTNDYTTEDKNKLTGVATGAEVNKIDAVKVNGTALEITDKAVNIDLSNYATKSTTLAGYGITNAYTKDEVNTELGKKANSSDVYTKTEVNDALANKLSNTDVIDGGTF